MLETLDHTIRIGSTPTFLYFDLNTEYKADNLIYQNPSCHYLYKYLYNANKTWRVNTIWILWFLKLDKDVAFFNLLGRVVYNNDPEYLNVLF